MDEQQRYDTPAELIARGVEIFDPEIFGWAWGFLIRVTRASESTVNFEVREITSRSDVDLGSEPYLTAYMKWDSCMHVNFVKMGDDGDGYLHMCGVHAWLAHAAIMKRIYHKAFEVMGRKPEAGEEWPT